VKLLPLFAVSLISLISVSQEIDIGRQANAEARKQLAELHDAQVTAYVRQLGKRISAVADGADYPYSFTVANDRELNAFALPGGPVWIHRGILQAATNEAQVASVLAHEVAHISQRHAADQLTKSTVANLGLGLLSAMLGSGTSAQTSRVAASFLANGVFLKFSRDDEREADAVGLRMMSRAGWDPRGMIEMFDILSRESQRDPGRVDTFFSTHPSAQDRKSRLMTDAARLKGGRRDSPEFRTMKAHLGGLK
jgi:beta-barrel assembly-enhancing protease